MERFCQKAKKFKVVVGVKFKFETPYCKLIDKVACEYVDVHSRQKCRQAVGLGPCVVFLSLFYSVITKCRSSLWINKRGRILLKSFIFCKFHNIQCCFRVWVFLFNTRLLDAGENLTFH